MGFMQRYKKVGTADYEPTNAKYGAVQIPSSEAKMDKWQTQA